MGLELCACVWVRVVCMCSLSVEVFLSFPPFFSFFFLSSPSSSLFVTYFIISKSVSCLASHVKCTVCRRSGSPRQHCDTRAHAGFQRTKVRLHNNINTSARAAEILGGFGRLGALYLWPGPRIRQADYFPDHGTSGAPQDVCLPTIPFLIRCQSPLWTWSSEVIEGTMNIFKCFFFFFLYFIFLFWFIPLFVFFWVFYFILHLTPLHPSSLPASRGRWAPLAHLRYSQKDSV